MSKLKKIGKWSKSALMANKLYDAHIVKKYGDFDESDITKTAFKYLCKRHGCTSAIQEAVRRQSTIGESEYHSKQLSERSFSCCGNKRGRFGVRSGIGFPRVSLCDFMYIYRDGNRVIGLKRLSLHVDDRWGLEC